MQDSLIITPGATQGSILDMLESLSRMGTEESWVSRRKKYGPSGVRNLTLKKSRQTKSQLRRHDINGGHSEVTKKRIGIKSGKTRRGKLYPNSGQFKKGKNHTKWQGGKHVYWHKQARKVMVKAGFNIRGFHVHHINHDFTDNRLENLDLLSAQEHGRLHALERRGEFI